MQFLNKIKQIFATNNHSVEEFNHARYQENLKHLADLAYSEYRYLALEIPKRQTIILRTYLWLASIISAFQLTFYAKVFAKLIDWPLLDKEPDFWFFIFGTIAITLSFSAFVLGVDTLRGRGQSRIPLGNTNDLVELAYKSAFIAGSQQYYISVIGRLQDEIELHSTQCGWRGIRLRRMCRLILGAVVFIVLSGIALAVTPASTTC